MNRIISIILLVSTICVSSINAQGRVTVEDMMEHVKSIYPVSFVYDSSIKLSIPYSGKKPSMVSLENSLETIFSNTGIKWEINGDYVILKRLSSYTLSGYIYQENGETVINATVWDITSNTGTLTNEHGFFSLTLNEGKHKIRFSHISCGEQTEDITLKGNKSQNMYLKADYRINEVVVTADLNSPIHTTQTGKVSLTAKDFVSGNNFMSSPDVVKKLQSLSGVASGTELISGLYVHGGGNDENLFLLDGTPLYQVNHAGGLFSAFNTDIVKNIDTFNADYPAPASSSGWYLPSMKDLSLLITGESGTNVYDIMYDITNVYNLNQILSEAGLATMNSSMMWSSSEVDESIEDSAFTNSATDSWCSESPKNTSFFCTYRYILAF